MNVRLESNFRIKNQKQYLFLENNRWFVEKSDYDLFAEVLHENAYLSCTVEIQECG